jgi:aspartyl-tRNA(Asn)/glutamyl-tRNA(Gln) amidotransferase subunit B
MNSFKALHDALAYEIVRQADSIEQGGRIVQETRHWDVGAKRTSALRSKEEAHDYRYFPEPDMVPFEFSAEYIACIKERLPELPDAKRTRFMAEYGLPPHDATVLTSDLDLSKYFEAEVAIAGAERAKAISNVMLNDLSAYLNANNLAVGESRIGEGMIAELVELVEGGTISGKQAKDVFAEMAETGDAPGAIVELRGMKQVSDTAEIEAVVDRVLETNPDQVAGYRGGKAGLIGFFVGQVMREMGGQANPQIVNEVLKSKLG